MTTPLPSIDNPLPILIPPRTVALAVGKTYPPAAAAILPLASIVIVVPSGMTPPKVDVVATGNVYAEGIVGLFKISPRPDVASQSG